jgi:geranylgeranyl reductase family protein
MPGETFLGTPARSKFCNQHLEVLDFAPTGKGALEPIAIVGGGPAGAFAAEYLARGGHRVIVIDERLAWEKPCGGGVTPKALFRYPYLADAAVERNWVRACELISPAGRRVVFDLEQKIAIFSRTVLNGFLLDRARKAGAEVLHDRVVEIEQQGGGWRLRMRTGTEIVASFVVLAGGARNSFRAQFSRAFLPEELMVTAGYYVRGSSERIQVRFVPGLEGYIWTFPRCDHFSAGICGKITDGNTTARLRQTLEAFLDEEGFDFRSAAFYSHLLPAPNANTLKHASFSGEGWAMVGDAAGFVDPITGEGLYYAFRSAELLAQALLAKRPSAYRTLLSQDLLPELAAAARYAQQFFHGTFLGQPILERMVQFTAESRKFRALISDLFAGAQAYVNLRGRCYRQLLPVLWETVAS